MERILIVEDEEKIREELSTPWRERDTPVF